MAIFLKNQGEHNGIHSIPEDIRNSIMVLVYNAHTNGSPETIKVADSIERYINLYNATEIEQEAKEKLIDALTADQEEKLKEQHAEEYSGTDDDMPDAYEQWLEDLTSHELKSYID